MSNQIKSGLSRIIKLQHQKSSTARTSPLIWTTKEKKDEFTRNKNIKNFSTTSSLFIKTKKQKKEIERAKEKAYEIKKQKKENIKLKTKPDPILGYSTQISKDYLRWEKCELKSLILNNEDVWSGKVQINDQDTSSSSGNVLLNFGLNDDQTSKLILFDGLPQMKQILSFKNQPLFNPPPSSSTTTTLSSSSSSSSSSEQEQDLNNDNLINQDQDSSEIEKKKKLLRIFDLRNSDSKGIDKFIKNKILKAFSPKDPINPDKLDPGCSEVQAAITTYRIHTVLKHAWANRRDQDSKRHLSDLVMKRMKILKYLRRTYPKRYLDLLPRIGLEPKYLKDELIVRAKLPLRPGESLD